MPERKSDGSDDCAPHLPCTLLLDGLRVSDVKRVDINAGPVSVIASGFGISEGTLWSWGQALDAGANPIPEIKAPNRNLELTERAITRIHTLSAARRSNAVISPDVSVSDFSFTRARAIEPAYVAALDTAPTTAEPVETAFNLTEIVCRGLKPGQQRDAEQEFLSCQNLRVNTMSISSITGLFGLQNQAGFNKTTKSRSLGMLRRIRNSLMTRIHTDSDRH